jgi:hypothetical protein
MRVPSAAIAAVLALFGVHAKTTFSVSIATPSAGATLQGSVAWRATVANGTASQVTFWIDGQQRWTDKTAPYEFGTNGTLDTRTLADGNHTLAVKAVNRKGRSATASVGVTVANGVATAPPPPPPPPASPPPPPPPPASPPPPPPPPSRVVYCFGDPAYGSAGWQWDGTSLGWIRQAPDTVRAQRVVYDDSVPLLAGCHTIRAEVQALDPVLWGGVRAQLYATTSLLHTYGSQPALQTGRGIYGWWGFAFATNPGYKPQSSLPNPDWNTVFSWHDTGCGSGCSGPQGNVELDVATAEPDGHGGWRFFSTPKLELSVYGGDPSDPNWWSKGRRWFVGDFVPGKRYEVQMGVKWGDAGDGTIELWLDGRQVVPATAVSNLWSGMNVYPLFENYRPADTSVTWTNDVYYGGLVSGPTRADVGLS